MVRLFTGFQITNTAQAEIKAFCKSVISGKQPIKWIPDENLHITSVFIGSVSAIHLNSIKADLNTISKEWTPFILQFEQFQLIKKDGIPVMIWAKFASNLNYEKLILQISGAVKKYYPALKVPDPPMPHITIARLHKSSGGSIKWDNHPTLSDINCHQLLLWQSQLHPKGSGYAVLEKFPFSDG